MAGVSRLALLLCWSIAPAAAQLSSANPVLPRLQALVEARDFPAAERELKRELLRAPDWHAGHLLLARIYLQTARYELAERSAQAAIRTRESLDGFLLLALATLHLGRLNDSIGWLERAARLRPDHPEIYRILGLDYALGGSLPLAEQAFRRAAELGPGNWQHHYFHGRTLFELRRHQEALVRLEQAVKLNGSSAKAWTALGQAQERLGDTAQAEAGYRRAILVCGAGRECAWPLLQLGFLRGVQGGPREALPHFLKAVEARPDWARPHFHLGKTLAALDDFAAARTELERAVELDGSRPEYHYQLAQVYRRLNEPAKAAAQFARFRKLRNAPAEPAEGSAP